MYWSSSDMITPQHNITQDAEDANMMNYDNRQIEDDDADASEKINKMIQGWKSSPHPPREKPKTGPSASCLAPCLRSTQPARWCPFWSQAWLEQGTFLSYLATIRPIEPRWQFWMEMMMIVEVATIEVLPLHNGCHLERLVLTVFIS